ncbi:MAG: NAD(P)/FAD-dependent oxidoreductase [Herpetosiphonaceae bacterium]|nr:NAD(P)/FAD-dependent oxidoreductase [Herpetosiphonaceae bacterium]
MQTWDLIVIGGGPAGETAAMEAIEMGARVALVEQSGKYGGTCRYAGCTPSKTLLHSAEVLHMMRQHAPAVGLPVVNPDWDFRTVLRHKDDVILRTGGEDGYDVPRSFREAGGQTFTGTARFQDSHTLNVAGELLQGEHMIIATGSRPRVPLILGLAEAGYLTWEAIFDLTAVPEALAIIGGGPLGVELSQAFHRFGSRVTVWEAEDMIIPHLCLW